MSRLPSIFFAAGVFHKTLIARYPQTKDLMGLLCSLVIGLLAAYWPYYLDHRFYYNDDEQTAAYPYYLEIGQQLRQGHWPFITLTTLNGGYLISDWQSALFNPISLLSYWLIAPIRDLCYIGLVLASFYISFMAMGGYLLARSFDLRRILSVIAATVLCTNNFIIYIYSHSWIGCLAASCWFLWAWPFIQFYRSTGRLHDLLAAIIFGYFTLSAGWPQAIIMLGILVLSYLIEMIVDTQCPRSRPLSLAISMIAALMLVTPALLPAVLNRAWTARPTSFSSYGLFMPNLGDFLNLSAFDLIPRMGVFVETPIMHLAWFIIPLIPFLQFKFIASTLLNRWALGLAGGVDLFLLFGPQSIGPIRWPFRFLPLAHIVILIGFLLVINKSEVFVISRKRWIACVVLLFITLTSSISTYPDDLELHMFYASLLGFLTWIAVELIRVKSFRMLALWLLIGVILGYTGTHYSFRHSFAPDFGSNSQVFSSTPASAKVFHGYTLCLSGDFDKNQPNWSSETFIGAQGILSGERTINGYSSIGHRTFAKQVTNDLWTNITSPAAIAYLFSIDSLTRLRVVDLLRVNTLIVEKKIDLPIVTPYLGSTWKETREGVYTVRFDRLDTDLRPTTLAWATPGTTISDLNNPTGENESIRVATTSAGSNLIFARLWWPGYAATLNGTPVQIKPFNELLVSVLLPPHAEGILSLTFTPPGYRLGLIIALLGLLTITVVVFLNIWNCSRNFQQMRI